MENNNMQQISFWKFLNSHKIEIPIIQRDYAQGRIGKEKLREKFLSDLKNILDPNLGNKKILKMDFVYGSIENDNLNPLDGQQRLTTLWLLHWYIAYKAGKLEENKSFFKKFSYESRVSSRDFCRKLADFHMKSDEKIVLSIQNQTWFFSEWKQDPTIQAMLNMLGGTPIKDKEQNEIIDGIEEVFNGCDESSYIKYWEILTSEDCPIIFYYLDLQGLSLSDDLYIKMNARGKSLTSFENFKADLVGYMKDKKQEEEKDIKETIVHKLDTSWTDIFWEYRSAENKIDEIYFAFINRFLLSGLVTAKESESYKYTQEDIRQIPLFEHVFGKAAREYNGFEIYENEESFCKIINRLKKILDNFYKLSGSKSKEYTKSLFYPSWGDEDSYSFFVPEYNQDENSKPITLPQRVVFHAICCYFERGEYDEISLKCWMRVVWNIVENGNITDQAIMIQAMRLIEELADYSRLLYETLANTSFDIKSDFAREQIREEREKARIIKAEEKNWEEKIIEAENQKFFKGRIGYLLKASENNIERLEQILMLCREKLKIDDKELLINYLTYIDIDTLPLSCNISNYNGWKEILTNKNSEKATIEFFKNNLESQSNDGSWTDWKNVLITDFDEIEPLKCTINNYCRWGYEKDDVFVYVNANISGAKLLSSKRKAIVKQLIEENIIQSNFSLYPNTNDRGQLWIYQHDITEDFKLKLRKRIGDAEAAIFLDNKNNVSLKSFDWKNGWKDEEFTKIFSPVS
jgi:hypothetical protein